MKAIAINKTGDSQVMNFVDDYPLPKPADDEVIISIDSTSVNRIDLVMAKGYPGLQLNYPHILGGDIAGTIIDTNSVSSEFEIGDRVVSYPIVLPKEKNPKFTGMEQLNDGWQYFGMHRNGSYAEYVTAPTEGLVKIPKDMSFEIAATIPVAGLTAYHSVVTVGALSKGDIFMIWGATGGLGTFAVQLAKHCGATVIATTGNDAKKKILESLGADYVFNHNTDDVVSEVRKVAPGGIDVLLDYVGPQTFEKSFSLLRKNGKLLLCGMLTGMETKLHIQQTYFRHINIHGLFLGSLSEFSQIVKLISYEKIKPYIFDTFDLKDASKAHSLIASGESAGKIILKI